MNALTSITPDDQVSLTHHESCPLCGAPSRALMMVSHIQAIVAAYYHIPVREMTSQRRNREVARPRQVAMYLSYELTPKSYPEIAKRFGDRDHTTIMHGVRVIQKLIAADEEIAEDIRILRQRFARPE